MERLTETKFEKEMRIGFSKIDRIFDDAISKLDAMKAEYEKKLAPTAGKISLDAFSMRDQLQWSMGRFGQAMPIYRSPLIDFKGIA